MSNSPGKFFGNLVSRFGDVIWPKMIAAKKADVQSSFSNAEKALVIFAAYIIAIGLWVMVNLDNEFNLNLKLTVSTGEIAEGLALVSPLPETVDVSVSGVGWNLLNLYNSPPEVLVNLADDYVDMTDQVSAVVSGYQNINLIRVQPTILNVDVEQRITKKVPVVLNLELEFESQFNLVGKPVIRPDSVTISGAISRVQSIESWPTQVYTSENIRETLNATIPLESPSEVIEISNQSVSVTARVSEYTEGELRLPLRIRGLPRGVEVVFNPATITVRYEVPLDQYQSTQDTTPFGAFVDYDDLVNNTTGLVTPDVEFLVQAPNITLKTIQPRTVSFFIVVNN
jgi:YbbR domain-containing protein